MMSPKALSAIVVLLLLFCVRSFAGCFESERLAFLKFKQSLFGDLSSWNETEDCCKWYGIACDNSTGHVVQLTLSGYDLKGNMMSPSLLELPHLNYLDLSLIYFGGARLPEFIGSLDKLTTLKLAFCNLSGAIPFQLGNLSRLETLDLGDNYFYGVESLEWISHLSSLKLLDLSRTNLSKANWLNVVLKLPTLEELFLCDCSLEVPKWAYSSFHFNSSTSLRQLDLSDNSLTSSIYPWLLNSSSNLEVLNLDSNNLSGCIPFQLGNLSRLETLDLGHNYFYGVKSLEWISNLSSLTNLHLSDTNLSKANWLNFVAKLPRLEELSLRNCSLEVPKWASSFHFKSSTSLQLLYLDYNSLTSSIYPWLLNSSSNLVELNLDSNKLQVPIPHTLGNLTSLESLSLSNNKLEGGITEEHLSNLSRLTYLDLSGNSLSFKLSLDWDPPFQLNYLYLSSCTLGLDFPRWLQTQSSLQYLDISNTSITGHVPNWIWDISSEMKRLNISHNHLNGMLPNITLEFLDSLDLSGNNFEGPIPQFPSYVSSLVLSNNSFTGSMSVLCAITGWNLKFLDLSNNVLSGKLPDCWNQFPELVILNVANNNLFGNIPKTIGSLRKMEVLDFYNNNFSGVLPINLKNCVALKHMNLGNNRIRGEIPIWMGENLLQLIVLSLRSNSFYGSIPSQFCHLQWLQVLDLSLNNISGTIPKCVKNFKAMAQNESSDNTYAYQFSIFGNNYFPGIYIGNIVLAIKGVEYDYRSILRFVFAIDLSGNQLIGDIPVEITNLVGLVALNSSQNNLSGSIPKNVGHLNKLFALDLSKNMLKGEIPTSLATISSLSRLDISFNNLSGKIPISTQLQSMNVLAYIGNPGLCGLPLDKCNSLIEDDGNTQVPKSEDTFFTLWFYVPMELGYMIGLFGFFITLYLNGSWRYSYCRFLYVLVKKVYG